MKIAILGGGHGCYAAAADLSEAGHEVRLWRRDAAALEAVARGGGIVLKDAAGVRDVKLALASADIGAVLRGSQLVVIPSPAIAQADIAQAMAPHLVSGQVVFLPPGTFGSFVMAQVVRRAGNPADVAWAETGTLPYLARKHGEREVNVTVRAIHLPTGVYPARAEAAAIEVIRQAYPSVHGCGDALSGAPQVRQPVPRRLLLPLQPSLRPAPDSVQPDHPRRQVRAATRTGYPGHGCGS
jgi:opine dehydrogenase